MGWWDEYFGKACYDILRDVLGGDENFVGY